MDRELELSHRAAVGAWLARTVDDRSPDETVRLVHAACVSLWNRAVATLGSVTLTAIAERVLHHTTERHAFLSAIIRPRNGHARWAELPHERLTAVPRSELIEAAGFALVELLTVLGAFTAEILTPELHDALVEITPDTAAVAGSHPRPEVAVAKAPA